MKRHSVLAAAIAALAFTPLLATAFQTPPNDCATATPYFKLGDNVVAPPPHGYACLQRALGGHPQLKGWYVQAMAGAHLKNGMDGNTIRLCKADKDGKPEVGVKALCAAANPAEDLVTGPNGCAVCGNPMPVAHP